MKYTPPLELQKELWEIYIIGVWQIIYSQKSYIYIQKHHVCYNVIEDDNFSVSNLHDYNTPVFH